MYDFTQYKDGYTGDVIDSVSGVTAQVTGLSTYSSGRTGFSNGELLINTHRTEGCNFTIPTHESFTNYPFTFEFYGAVRGEYNEYAVDGKVEFVNGLVPSNSAVSGDIFSTREGGNGNGYMVRYLYDSSMTTSYKMQINGTLSSPLINVEAQLNPAYYGNEQVTYHHIVVALDNNMQKIWIDGQLISDTTNSATKIEGSTNTMKLFKDKLKANMRLIRIYNTVLTNNQVLTNYNNVITTIGGDN